MFVRDIAFIDKLQLKGRNLGRVFNFRSGHFMLLSQAAELKPENSARTTSWFSPVDIALPVAFFDQ
jgi:hypothetical protein